MIVEISKSSKNSKKCDARIDGKKLLVLETRIIKTLLHIKIMTENKDT